MSGTPPKKDSFEKACEGGPSDDHPSGTDRADGNRLATSVPDQQDRPAASLGRVDETRAATLQSDHPSSGIQTASLSLETNNEAANKGLMQFESDVLIKRNSRTTDNTPKRPGAFQSGPPSLQSHRESSSDSLDVRIAAKLRSKTNVESGHQPNLAAPSNRRTTNLDQYEADVIAKQKSVATGDVPSRPGAFQSGPPREMSSDSLDLRNANKLLSKTNDPPNAVASSDRRTTNLDQYEADVIAKQKSVATGNVPSRPGAFPSGPPHELSSDSLDLRIANKLLSKTNDPPNAAAPSVRRTTNLDQYETDVMAKQKNSMSGDVPSRPGAFQSVPHRELSSDSLDTRIADKLLSKTYVDSDQLPNVESPVDKRMTNLDQNEADILTKKKAAAYTGMPGGFSSVRQSSVDNLDIKIASKLHNDTNHICEARKNDTEIHSSVSTTGSLPGAFASASDTASGTTTESIHATFPAGTIGTNGVLATLSSFQDKVAAKEILFGNHRSKGSKDRANESPIDFDEQLDSYEAATAIPGALATMSRTEDQVWAKSILYSCPNNEDQSRQSSEPGDFSLSQLGGRLGGRVIGNQSTDRAKSDEIHSEPLTSATNDSLDALSRFESQIQSKERNGRLSLAMDPGQNSVESMQKDNTLLGCSKNVSLDLMEAEESILKKNETELPQGRSLLNRPSDGGIDYFQKDSDLEHGLHGGPGEHGLAVAVAVEEEYEDMYIPAAVEYDPDAKPPIYRNRRFRLYACLAMVVVAVGIFGALAGLLLTTEATFPPPLLDRSTLGIREHVERMVGSEQLDDINNPYRKALDWIQNVDPMALTPNNKTFTQRFLAAYFHFSTSVKKPWGGGCNAPVDGESDVCEFTSISGVLMSNRSRLAKRWLSSGDECFWLGLSCDKLGQIFSIDVAGANMTGTFPEGISRLPFLQSLLMAHGELEGSLPAVLGEMKHLIRVELFGNLFTGSIPQTWYDSRSIQYINVGINSLTGSVSTNINHLQDLKGFLAFENTLTGTIPKEIGDVRSLTYLWLNNNLLRGSIPTVIGNLNACYNLNLHRNKITGSIPTEMGRNVILEDFSVHNNNMNGTIPLELLNLVKLEQFYLNDNQFSGSLPAAGLGNWSLVYKMRIENNNFTGTLPTELGKMKELAVFTASGNSFGESVPDQLCRLRAPVNDVSSQKKLVELQVDCSVSPETSVAEISCECCTQCCDASGGVCSPML